MHVSGTDHEGTVTSYQRQWVNPSQHFDNVARAILSLFQVATLESWNDIAHRAMSTTSVGEAPRPNANPAAFLYFFVFIISCAYFTFQLFIGVVLDNFNRLRQENDGSAFLTQ